MILSFPQLVHAELTAARRGHKPMNSVHEGYAVILEEMEEFWDECKKKSALRDKGRMLDELVQIAAMCQRCAEDCGLVDRSKAAG